jgi:hypothetical protein
MVKKFIEMVSLAEQVCELTLEQNDICNTVQTFSYTSNSADALYGRFFIHEDFMYDNAEDAFLHHFNIGKSSLNDLADEFDYQRVA